jgi:tRNA threonylcarbamoyladenosine biosynthesis protein TsaE
MGGDWLTVISLSPEVTEALGSTLAPLLPMGAVLALRGDLASGKTCFTRGLTRRLVPGAAVSSPTFVIVNEYRGAMTVYHADLYRLNTLSDVRALGCEELFTPVDGVTIVEWAERAESLLPELRIDIAFEHAGGDDRRITFSNRGVLEASWQRALQDALV